MEDFYQTWKSMEILLEKTDREINDRLTLIDSKKNSYEEIPFESQKLIYSLTNIGIPLNYSFKILNMIIENINRLQKDSTINTSDIRKLVANSLYILYTIDDVKANVQKCQIWGDLYLRKFGHPYGPIKIIHRDGQEDILEHSTLEEEIIPAVLSKILNKDKAFLMKKFSKKERNEMRDEVMRIIQDFGIYKIHHQTLCLLVKDLAMQPPHPWIFDPQDIDPYIRYNLDRSNKNFENLKMYYGNNDLPNCRNSIRESLHHISASILGYYEEIPGCGFLAPFYNLKNLVHNIILFNKYCSHKRYDYDNGLKERAKKKMDEIDLFGRSKIWDIEQDLHHINNISLEEFHEKMEGIDHDLRILHNSDIIPNIINKVEQLKMICDNLVYKKYYLKDELNRICTCREIDKYEKGKLFEEVVFKILNLSEGFVVKKNIKIKNKQYDIVLEHNLSDGLFSRIGQFIYVECKNHKENIDVEIIEKLGNRILTGNKDVCNMGIIISESAFSEGAKEEAIRYFNNNQMYIILINKESLYELIDGDLVELLNDKLNSLFYGKI